MVLFDVGFGPATKGDKVGEGRVAIVVSVPQGGAGAAGVSAAHDGVPLRGGGVDADVEAGAASGGEEAGEEGLVGAGGAGPVLGALDVEPEHAELDVVVAERIDGLVDLRGSRGGAGGAREKVHVNVAHAASPGVGHALGAVGVGLASAHVAAHDSEMVAIGNQARKAALRGQCGEINSRI